jgi:YidC/Oxa1 family membrane protein insertase
MAYLFQVIFYQPILNLLIFLYNTVSFHDLGVAIILLTVLIRFLLWPLSNKSIKQQKALQELQPKITALKEKHKDNKQQMSLETMKLYKDNKINPFSSCLPLLLQLPFLFAVFRVFRDGLNNKLDLVYSFIHRPEIINTIAFGFFNLSKTSWVLAAVAGAAQFWQAKMLVSRRPDIKTGGSKDEDMAAIMNKQMTYFMPVLTIFIGLSLPAGLTLYWCIVTLMTVWQQSYLFKKHAKANAGANASISGPKNVIEGEIVK